MKKLYVLLFTIAATTAFAQNRTVIFGVDMTGTTLRATDSILIGGSFTTPAWTPKSFKLTRQGATSNLFARSFSLPVSATAVSYKFVINDWNPTGTNEFLDGVVPAGGCAASDGGTNVNRNLVVAAGTGPQIVLFKYNTCTATTLTLSNKDLRSNMSVVVAPNPMTASTYLAFDNPNNQVFTVNMTNMMGQQVRSYKNVSGYYLEIQKGELGAGVYFLTMTDKEGRSLTEKLVIE